MKTSSFSFTLKIQSLAAIGIIFFGCNTAYAGNYSLTVLPTLKGGQCIAQAMNNKGQVVGECDGHAVLWTESQVIDLTPQLQGNYTAGTAFSINDSGDVVYTDGASVFLLRGGFSIKLLNSVSNSGAGLYPWAINSHGKVVGTGYAQPDANSGTARWSIDPDGQQHLTQFPADNSGSASTASSINKNGVIAGSASDEKFLQKAAVWRNNKLSILDPSSHLQSEARSVNVKEVVVGWFGDFDTKLPFKWENGMMTALEVFPSFRPWGVAMSINDKGHIVGNSATDQGGRAVIWRKDKLIDLNDLLSASDKALGWNLAGAQAINHAGAIAGYLESKADYQVRRAFVMTPPAED